MVFWVLGLHQQQRSSGFGGEGPGASVWAPQLERSVRLSWLLASWGVGLAKGAEEVRAPTRPLLSSLLT